MQPRDQYRDSLDPLAELENGTLQPPPPPALAAGVVPSAEVAHRWAVALGLRPGTTRGPASTALVPVVHAWAEQQGLTGPGPRDVGRGLAWAGLRQRMSGGTHATRNAKHLCLHRDDAALLWRLVRAAWAPGRAPGDRKQVRRKPAPRLAPRQPPAELFHEALAALCRPAPLVDSLGRVWPSPSVAARHLGGTNKQVDNARRALAGLLASEAVDSRTLRAALSRGLAWRGVWWRHLTPAEVRAVPHTHLVGHPLPAYGWGLTCPTCGAHPTPTL